LHAAMTLGNMDLIKELLNHGADPNAVLYKDGPTPLNMAVQVGNLEMVKALLAHGANTDQPYKEKNGNFTVALKDAIQANNSEIVKELLRAGVKLDVPMGALTNIKPYHAAILRYAKTINDLELVDLLLQRDANFTVFNKYSSPLAYIESFTDDTAKHMADFIRSKYGSEQAKTNEAIEPASAPASHATEKPVAAKATEKESNASQALPATEMQASAHEIATPPTSKFVKGVISKQQIMLYKFAEFSRGRGPKISDTTPQAKQDSSSWKKGEIKQEEAVNANKKDIKIGLPDHAEGKPVIDDKPQTPRSRRP
jgi:hypothetical protein